VKGKDHLEGVDADGIMILILVLKKVDGRMCNWINLAEERDK
jgi:hypothetical protein